MRGCQGVIVVCSHGNLLTTEADVIIVIRIGIRATGLEHVVIGVIESETSDEHMSTFVAVTVKTLDGAGDVASESHAAVRIVNTLTAATGSVAA